MNNKLKESLDYFRHRTDLFETPEMEIAISNKGFNIYGVYCLLCEKSSRNINSPLILDTDMIHLLARKVGMVANAFKECVEELVKRNLFDKDSYYENNIITNGIIEEGKEITKNKRASRRGESKTGAHFDKTGYHLAKTLNNSKSNSNIDSNSDSESNSNSYIDSHNDIDSNPPVTTTKTNDSISDSLSVNGVLIQSDQDIYNIVEDLMEARVNPGIRNSLDIYINENVLALTKALENCQNSKNGAVSFNYIKKAYSQEKLKLKWESRGENSNYELVEGNEVDELERLKEERRKRKLLQCNDELSENNDDNDSIN